VLEVTLALVVLSVVVTALAQLLATAAAHRRASEERRLALQEAANQAERLALWSWDETSPERLGGLKASGDLLAAVPSATLNVALSDEVGPPAAKRVRIDVQWNDAAGQPAQPVGLTLWKHRPAEDSP
jgi:hypothetical protein